MLLKADLEKIFMKVQYIYTMVELAEHFSSGSYFDIMQAIDYYNKALEYCLETNTDEVFKIYSKMVQLYEKIDGNENIITLSDKMVKDYFHLITQKDILSVYGKLAQHYYSSNQYIKSFEMYDKYAKKISTIRSNFYSSELIFFRSIISCIATKNLGLSKSKLDEYFIVYPFFECSEAGQIIKNIIYAIDEHNINNFNCAINYCNTMQFSTIDDKKIMNYLSRIYF